MSVAANVCGSETSSTVTRLPTALAREEILGLIWAAVGQVRVPARCWPLQIALELLEARSPSSGRVRRALDAWPVEVTSHGRGRTGIDGLLRDLAISGALHVEGTGWEAGYLPTSQWLERGFIALTSLGGPEREAVKIAAQRLVASLTIWSKKSRADLSDRSVTS